MAELIVSIGILLLMFALAGQVFNLTIQSTGQATALTEVSQLLRAVEQTLREDLRHVRPGQSMLLIQGNPVNAYWTRRGKEADDNTDPSDGYPHPIDPERRRQLPDGRPVLEKPRADILMFFTARKGESHVHHGVTSNLQQVVYGHAEMGKWARQTSPFGATSLTFQPGPEAYPAQPTGYPSPDRQSPVVPAESWHLARRSVLLMPTASPPPQSGEDCPWVDPDNPECVKDKDAPAFGLASDRIIRGETEAVANFDFNRLVMRPGIAPPFFLPEIFTDGIPEIGRYEPDKMPFRRSRLDPSPPATLADRLGHYFLPHCASFKVEWTLDPRSTFVDGRLEGMSEVLWFDPGVEPDMRQTPAGHPLQSLEAACTAAGGTAASCQCRGTPPPASAPLAQRLRSLYCDARSHPDGDLNCTQGPIRGYSLRDRFLGPLVVTDNNCEWSTALTPDKRPNLVLFSAARWETGTNQIVPEDVFPSALRITIDVYDREGRLDRPIRHVMVIPVGG